ncbi:hypothetical protein S40285_03107 [Stachybotrys chlorohalonatus IBT 40285]|uniref:Rab-GAP TBC domain-containing protein n=1 Tax=Stachybotrys chlorohalonatus (strain IBT 40285) TaxID=1283841 RepID=A0A084QMB0_STAC4|nr:hypothetical protein S40285_03107 [Stachybotrys chlorohalonata IBT 40285]
MNLGLAIHTRLPSPGSPPGMTASKSSKSSSFHSLNSDDGSVLADTAHFEEIGLEDDAIHLHSQSSEPKSRQPSPKPLPGRNLASGRRAPVPRRSQSNLDNSGLGSNPRSTSLTVLTDPRPLSGPRQVQSTTSIRRHRSTSPGLSLNPRDPNLPPKPRRSSWQANRQRKSVAELEAECDEDDGDDIPDGLLLDNVPISPRPQQERPPSRNKSNSPSPDRSPLSRVRSVGNGTPAIAQAQGSLRSPTWKAEAALAEKVQRSPRPSRVNSWDCAHAELSAETKALTEKLEEHADELLEQQQRARRSSGNGRPNTWNSSQITGDYSYERKERIKSTPELPPLRRTNIMIDPLPISKEKEAVLSRTRPSWLPPKDPSEERRHLREYQKMMAASAKADERREASRRAKADNKDSAADSKMHIWENDIIPRWNQAIRERRTREMWWKGVAPRSRGAVWVRAIGNQLELSETSFRAALRRAQDIEERVKADRGDSEDARRAKWFAQIRQDVRESTLRDLRIFQEGGPLHQSLVDVLSAYAMYRDDIGYAPTCNTIAALLLLNLPGPELSFIALANVLNRPLPLSFYASDMGAQASAYNLVLQMLRQKSPKLHEHLTNNVDECQPDYYMQELFMALFTRHLALDEAVRLWDVYVFEGDAVLVRAAVAFLLTREMTLLGCKTIDEVVEVLTTTSGNASPVPGQVGAEERFITAVREAGKA